MEPDLVCRRAHHARDLAMAFELAETVGLDHLKPVDI